MKLFWHKSAIKQLTLSSTASLTNWFNVNRKHFCIAQSVLFSQHNSHQKLWKFCQNFRKRDSSFIRKKFSTHVSSKNVLMDFNVELFPSFFNFVKVYAFLRFTRSFMDPELNLQTLEKNTNKALEVVTVLLSQLRFTELKGLLADNCLMEIEKNLKSWSEEDISVLAIRPEHIKYCAPFKFNILTDHTQARLYLEMTCLHYVLLKCTPGIEDKTEVAEPNEYFSQIFEVEDYDVSKKGFEKTHWGAVFNSRYIREIDIFNLKESHNWVINGINCRIFSNIQFSI